MQRRNPNAPRIHAGPPDIAAPGFPSTRMRRNRASAWSRRLVAEHVLTPADLIWPVFVVEGKGKRVPIASMPGVERLSVDLVVGAAKEAVALGIPAIALFPYTDPRLRSDDGAEAFNKDNLVCRATRAIKDAGLDIGVMLDVALDPYTSHGHDGLMRDGLILNDETLEALVKQSLVQAAAGCDIIAPSDMMDGRIGAIREGAGGGRPHLDADHGLFRQVRLRILRAVPRCGRLVVDLERRQAHLPDGLRQLRRGAARGRPRHRGRRRHGDGQARHALSRRLPSRVGDVRRADLRLPGVGRVFDADGGSRRRLPRRRQGDDRGPDGVQARRLRRHPDLLRATRSEGAVVDVPFKLFRTHPKSFRRSSNRRQPRALCFFVLLFGKPVPTSGSTLRRAP